MALISIALAALAMSPHSMPGQGPIRPTPLVIAVQGMT
jgi:hypothetical protein